MSTREKSSHNSATLTPAFRMANSRCRARVAPDGFSGSLGKVLFLMSQRAAEAGILPQDPR